MADYNLNLDMGGVLQPPNVEAIQAQVPVAKTQTPTTTQDTIATSTLSTTTTVNLLSDNPVPTEPTKVGTETLMQLGASSSTTGPGGPGGLANPWFQANPIVAFSIAYLEFFEALRESKSTMAEALVAQIGITMDLAQGAASLAMQAAKKESEQHMWDAIVAGIQLGVSVAGFAATVAQMAKAAGTKEMKNAKKEMDAEEANYNRLLSKLILPTPNCKFQRLG
jgi:hypothetical protein